MMYFSLFPTDCICFCYIINQQQKTVIQLLYKISPRKLEPEQNDRAIMIRKTGFLFQSQMNEVMYDLMYNNVVMYNIWVMKTGTVL